MKKRFLSLFLVTVMVLSTLAVFPVTVSAADTWGEGNNVISTLADLQAFEAAVEGGNTFSGATVKLAADITLPSDWNGIGARSDKPFSGTFDGQGYTITMSGHTADGINGAVFCMVKNATICNLKLDGTMTMGASFNAALVNCVHGTLDITNVQISTIMQSKSGVNIGYTGAFVGFIDNWYDGTITIDGCVFDGSMIFNNYSTNNGGFVGYLGNNNSNNVKNATIKNSVYAGKIIMNATDESTATGCFVGYAIGYSTVTVQDCVAIRGLIFDSNKTYDSKDSNGVLVGKYDSGKSPLTVSNFYYIETENSQKTGNLLLTPDGNGIANANNVKTCTLEEIAALTASNFSGDAKLAFKAAANGAMYIPCPEYFTTNDWPTSLTFEKEGEGFSESNPVINTLNDLKAFEAAVEGGNNFSGVTVTLAADITLPSDWNGIGARSDKPFNGTFDGQGHTITMSGHRETGTATGAIFNMVNGATVKNFRVVGSMTLTQVTSFSATVIGCAKGNVTVKDVHCSVDITGDGNVKYAGGIVGALDNYSNTTILFDGCIFDGSMTFKNQAAENGAFLGYTGNMSASDTKRVTIKNCVYAGTMTFRDYQVSKWNGCFVGFAKSGVSGATVYVEVRDSVSIGTMQFQNENAFSGMDNGIVLGDYSGTGNTNIIISNFYYMDIPNAEGTGVQGLVYANGRTYNTDGGVVKAVTSDEMAALTAAAFSNDATMTTRAADVDVYYPCPAGLIKDGAWVSSLMIVNDARVLGAQIRYLDDADQYTGIRFVAKFKADAEGVANAGSADATFGVILISKANYEALESKTFEALSAAGVKVNAIKATTEDGIVTVKAVIYNIDVANYTDEIVAIPYIGTALAGDGVARSIYSVAQDCVADANATAAAKTFAQEVINVVEG